MFNMKLKRILSFAFAALLVFTTIALASCANTDDETANTTYVSAYVYNKAGKRIVYLDALRVIPNENHEYEWGKQATPYLALNALCTERKKDCVITTDIGNNVTVESITTEVAGTSDQGVEYLWYVYVNGVKVEDSKNCTLKNYDLVEFKLEENTYRSINVTFNATNGAQKLISDQAISIMGDKNDLTLYNLFNISEFNAAAKKDGKTEIDTQQSSAISAMAVTFSEDKASIVKIGDVEAGEDKQWVIIVNDVTITTPATEIILNNGDKISFDLQEKIVSDETTADDITPAE